MIARAQTSECASSRRAPSVTARPRAFLAGMGLAGVGLLATPPVHADSALSNDGNSVSYRPPPAERRDGFTVGLVQHVGLAGMSGYPNRLAALGDPEQRSSTGAQAGQSAGLWIGGALRDWLTVGVGLASASTIGDDPMGVTSAFVLHVEGFPLFPWGGGYRDLGVALDVGTGFGQIRRGEDAVADGASLAHFGAGIFYEPFQLWQFSTGPSLSYAHQFSQSLSAHVVGLGWRFVFYGVQPG